MGIKKGRQLFADCDQLTVNFSVLSFGLLPLVDFGFCFTLYLKPKAVGIVFIVD